MMVADIKNIHGGGNLFHLQVYVSLVYIMTDISIHYFGVVSYIHYMLAM